MTQTHYHDFLELAELAQIEKDFAHSFDVKDTSFIVLEDLAQLNPEDWPAHCFKFQPSLQLLAFRHNSFEIWQALAKDTSPPELRQIERPAHWVIWRARNLISEYRPMPSAAWDALGIALPDQPFADICERLLKHYKHEDTPSQAIALI